MKPMLRDRISVLAPPPLSPSFLEYQESTRDVALYFFKNKRKSDESSRDIISS